MYKIGRIQRRNVNLGYLVARAFIIIVAVVIICVLCTNQSSKTIEQTVSSQMSDEVVLQEYIKKPDVIQVQQVTEIQNLKNANVVEKEIPEKKTYTDEEVRLLGDLMYAEEGVLFWKISDEEAKLAHQLAGSVVLHRKNHERFKGETIEDIIYTKGQYATTTLEKLGNIDTPEEVYEWAEALLRDGPMGPTNLVWQSEFEQGPVYKIIYNQYFCLLEE